MKTVLALLFILAAVAQQPQSIALSEQERQEAAGAHLAVEQARASLNEVGGIVLSTDVADTTKTGAAVCVAQIRQLRLQLAEAQQAGLLWKLRASHGCAECELAPDGKRLERGKP